MSEKFNLGLVAIGGNLAGHLDSPFAQVHAAIEQISQAGLEVNKRSRLFRTPCFPAGAGPDFVNAAVAIVTPLGAAEVLAVLHGIERAAGRERRARWGPRVIDLDLLALGDLVLPDRATFRAWAGLSPEERMTRSPDEIILPHPRLHERGFVLVPLNDIAPDWRHPVLGHSVAEMCAALPAEDIAAIEPLSQ